MANFAPYSRIRRKSSNRNVVYAKSKPGYRVYAPQTGTLRKRKGNSFALITSSGYVHKLYGVRPRKSLVGKRVAAGRYIGWATRKTVSYRRTTPKGKKINAMKVVRKPGKYTYATKPWKGTYRIAAGYRYSSGSFHGAWDVACWTGTPIYAPIGGKVVQANDGVKNNRPGYNPGPGSPANNVRIHGRNLQGQKVTVYLQHLSPGLKVRTGSRVKAGQLVGYSGDTGNSSGPHLHFQVQWGWRGPYDMYRNHSLCCYKPSRVYGP